MRKIIILLAVLLMGVNFIGATDYNVKYDGPLDSIKLYVWEDAVLTDSIVFDTGFLFDTILSLDETKAIRLQTGYFYTGYTYGLWAFDDIWFGSVPTTVSADMTAISGDATAADNFETMLDGTGGNEWSLGKLDISGANGTTGSFSVVNTTGNATVFDASSSSTSGGFVVRGGVFDYGFHATGGAGGILGAANSVDGGFGIGGTGWLGGPGIQGQGGVTGIGFVGRGGATSGYGAHIFAQAGNSIGFKIDAFGTAHGLAITAGTFGDGINTSGGSSSGDGLQAVGTGSGFDINADIEGSVSEAIITYYDFGVWLDAAAANTNTVTGVDGIPSNPVSTWAAARTIADNIGIRRYYIANGSDFSDTTLDGLTATTQEWEFISRGNGNNLVGIKGANVDGSLFVNLSINGRFGGNSNVSMHQCILNGIDDFGGYAFDSWLNDTLALKANSNVNFLSCASTVAGNRTPVLELGAAVNKINIRHYSGGIQLNDMEANDTASIETDGQVVISSTCNIGSVITLRGNMTIVDSTAGLTALTRDAALNAEYIVDQVYDEVNTGTEHNVDNSGGKQWRETDKTIHSGTAQAATINTITLDAGASSVDGSYDPAEIHISGNTGEGQSRLIYQYDGATKIAVVDRNWKVTPDATSEFVIHTNAGREHVNEGLAQAGTASTITLNELASSTNDTYLNQVVFIRSGTGDDQKRRVTGYNGTTKVATVSPDWVVTPDATSAYAMVDGNLHTTVVVADTNSLGEIVAVMPDDWTAADTAAYQGAASSLTVQQIVDGVWDELQSSHVTAGTFGLYLDAAISGVASSGLDTLSTVFVDRLTGRNADSIWLSLLSARDGVVGSFGDSAASWKGIAGSGIDSTILSNILHRVVWGTAVGSGSDSSTIAERDATIAVMVNNVLTAAAQATDAVTEIRNAIYADVDDYKADVSLLALQVEVVNLNGWNPATDSANMDMSTFESSLWNQQLLAFLGWGEINGLPIWSKNRNNADVDTLFVGVHLSGGPPTIDTIAAQMNWHPGGTAGDPPDSSTSVIW